MTRRLTGRLSAALALAVLLPASQGLAQSDQNANRRGAPPAGNLMTAPPRDAPAPRRLGPQIPNYYFERGPVVRPKVPVGPNDVASSLRARGFRDIGPMQQRGSTSITEAVGPAGERVQLVIGPNGDIVGVRVLNPGDR